MTPEYAAKRFILRHYKLTPYIINRDYLINSYYNKSNYCKYK